MHVLLVKNATECLPVRKPVLASAADVRTAVATLGAAAVAASSPSLIIVVGEDVSAEALAAEIGVSASALGAAAASGALCLARRPWLSACMRQQDLLSVEPAQRVGLFRGSLCDVGCSDASFGSMSLLPPPPPQAAAQPTVVDTRVPGLRLGLGFISEALEEHLFKSSLFAGSLPIAGESLDAYMARMAGAERLSRGAGGSLDRLVYGKDDAEWPAEVLEIFASAVRAGLTGDAVAARPDALHALLYSAHAEMQQHCDSWLAYGEVIAGISLGAPAVLRMVTQGRPEERVILPRASIYAMTGASRRSLQQLPAGGGLPSDAWRHGICDVNRPPPLPHPAVAMAATWNPLGLRASITLRCMRATASPKASSG